MVRVVHDPTVSGATWISPREEASIRLVDSDGTTIGEHERRAARGVPLARL
jgi:hypothetical protein